MQDTRIVTAICVNGDWLCQWERAIFDLLQNRHPSTDHQKICHRWLSRRPLQLCQIRCTYVHKGRLSTWVKYNQNFLYLYLFLGTHLQVRLVNGFAIKVTHLFRRCRFQQISLNSALAVRASEQSSIITNGKSTMCFLLSNRWTLCVTS